MYPFYMVIGSINGLICLFGGNQNTTCICNPVTREYVVLPKFARDSEDQYTHWSCGFGYLPTTNEYKAVVLNTSDREIDFIEVAVYTLGSCNGWKAVERLNTRLAKVYVYPGRGVFVNGSLHWRDKQEGKVVAFDLTEEKFSEYPPPHPCLSIRGWPDFTIGELGGVLYYAVEHKRQATRFTSSDIWLLKRKNDIPEMKEPLGWSGGVLCFDHRSLHIYNAISTLSRKLVDFAHLSFYNRLFPHKITLISLKELEKMIYK
ncbi:F-box/kelch-repeat protein At3g23880-like [Papaver somniferum]|uniref:F-box/kelch-repeat protein At3g23880-like n=1 Tax=Papaver somniferum TaxID=3469 RepID=UPI000E704ED9|nr:F-box/kelch-repeat protein At3g23880-like [Papaver somniferum]XP_026421793.1 F-box/kelch-repeat protein At3g23880-like [Papaver somniferum]